MYAFKIFAEQSRRQTKNNELSNWRHWILINVFMSMCDKMFWEHKNSKCFFLNLWMKFIFQEKYPYSIFIVWFFVYGHSSRTLILRSKEAYESEGACNKSNPVTMHTFSDTEYRDTVLCRSVTGNVVWIIKATNNLGIFLLLFFIVWWWNLAKKAVL